MMIRFIDLVHEGGALICANTANTVASRTFSLKFLFPFSQMSRSGPDLTLRLSLALAARGRSTE